MMILSDCCSAHTLCHMYRFTEFDKYFRCILRSLIGMRKKLITHSVLHPVSAAQLRKASWL